MPVLAASLGAVLGPTCFLKGASAGGAAYAAANAPVLAPVATSSAVGGKILGAAAIGQGINSAAQSSYNPVIPTPSDAAASSIPHNPIVTMVVTVAGIAGLRMLINRYMARPDATSDSKGQSSRPSFYRRVSRWCKEEHIQVEIEDEFPKITASVHPDSYSRNRSSVGKSPTHFRETDTKQIHFTQRDGSIITMASETTASTHESTKQVAYTRRNARGKLHRFL